MSGLKTIVKRTNFPHEIFVGGRKKGYTILKELLEISANVAYCFILKEDPHETERFSPNIEELCRKNNIPYTVCRSLRGKTAVILELQPELIIVAGWRTIIPEEILRIPRRGAVAFHESLLPRYRGFAPINWAVINGEKVTGVTLFYLDGKIDNGDIIGQERIPIRTAETSGDIYEKTIGASVRLLKKYHRNIIRGVAVRKPQDESAATYTCARIPEDGRIDWNKTTTEILNLIRGLSHPFPGAFSYMEGKKIIIQKTKPGTGKKYVGRIPGRIVSVNQEGAEVLTGDGSILVTEIQVKNKRKMSPEHIITSIKTTLK